MRRKNFLKTIFVLTACFFATVFAACASLGISSESKFTGFKEGYAYKVKIGETMLLEDFLDVRSDNKYTLIATNGVDEIDLTDRPTWVPDVAGNWTLKLEITEGANKGKYSVDITVTVPTANWIYSSKTLTYEYNSTVKIEKILDDLRIDVNSVMPYNTYIYSVRIGNKMVDIPKTQTEYTFKSYDTHYFTFGMETEDGQSYKAIARINVQETDPEAVIYCEDNNIEYHDYQQLYYRDGVFSASLIAGNYTGYFEKADLPYVAFRGNYGVDSYVSVDFTGKNLPKTAFFCDEITSSLYDKNRGFYISNGTVTNEINEKVAGDWSCLTFFGPYKMKEYHVNTGGSFGRESWASDPSPASREGLQEGVNYRYIVGYTNPIYATETTKGSIVVHMLLINLDTEEIVYDLRKTLNANDSTGPIEQGMLTGSIVLYGSYGVNTYWNNIRLVEKNVSSIYDLDSAIRFKENAPTYAIKGDSIAPTDFLTNTQLASAKLYYSFDGGEYQEFTTDVLLEKAGSYRIKNVPSDTDRRANSMVLNVNDSLDLDFEDGISNALQGYFRAGVYMEKENPISGNTSAKFVVGPLLPLNTSLFGVSYEYLDRVFADETVENVILSMRSTETFTLGRQNGYDSNGNRAEGAGGIALEKGKIVFANIPREYYENSRNHSNKKIDYSMYLFTATGTYMDKSNPQFTIVVDDVTTGKYYEEETFVYENGANLVYTFANEIESFYYAGEEYTNGKSGVVIDGKNVTLPSALIADKVGGRIQLIAKTASGVEVSTQKIVERISTYVVDSDLYTSENEISVSIEGNATSVKVGNDEIEYTQKGSKVYFKKAALAKYMGEVNVTITTNKGVRTIPITTTVCEINDFENADEIVRFKYENIGTCEVVGSDVITPYKGEKSYRLELPDMPNGGYHKIILPFAYIEELFSMPYVNAVYMFVALSYDGISVGGDRQSGNSVGIISNVYPFSAGTANKFKNDGGTAIRRIAIDSAMYSVLKQNEQDFTLLYIDSATHEGRTEYAYIDAITVSGTWSPIEQLTYTYADIPETGVTLTGFYGNVTQVLFANNEDVTTKRDGAYTLDGNKLTISKAELSSFYNGNRQIWINTDLGIAYSIKIGAKQ